MAARCLAALAATIALLAPRAALAEGAWAEGVLRPGYMFGTHRYSDQVNPGFGQAGVLELEAPISGFALEFAGAVGYAASKHFAVGGGPSLTLFGADAAIGASYLDGGYVGVLSMEAGWRPFGDELLLRFGAGLARATFFGSTNSIGSANNIFQFEPLHGTRFAAGAGWTHGIIAFSINVAHARLTADHSSFNPFVVGVGIGLQHWDLGDPRP